MSRQRRVAAWCGGVLLRRLRVAVRDVVVNRGTASLVAAALLTACGKDGLKPVEGSWLVNEAQCEWFSVTEFDEDLKGGNWTLWGDAHWGASGWLELTGNGAWSKGAVFNVEEPFAATRVDVGFRFFTGGGSGPGADGFSLTVLGVDSPQYLGGAGGCLGYGFGEACQMPVTVSGYHLEIDTWFNPWDPTTEDHVAFTRDGTPGAHYLWAAIGNIEDKRWHDVRMRVLGSDVQIWIDREEVLSGSIPGLQAFTGVIGFTGATGSETNYHRMDSLTVGKECR